jgi:hypothetical protein
MRRGPRTEESTGVAGIYHNCSEIANVGLRQTMQGRKFTKHHVAGSELPSFLRVSKRRAIPNIDCHRLSIELDETTKLMHPFNLKIIAR